MARTTVWINKPLGWLASGASIGLFVIGAVKRLLGWAALRPQSGSPDASGRLECFRYSDETSQMAPLRSSMASGSSGGCADQPERIGTKGRD